MKPNQSQTQIKIVMIITISVISDILPQQEKPALLMLTVRSFDMEIVTMMLLLAAPNFGLYTTWNKVFLDGRLFRGLTERLAGRV